MTELDKLVVVITGVAHDIVGDDEGKWTGAVDDARVIAKSVLESFNNDRRATAALMLSCAMAVMAARRAGVLVLQDDPAAPKSADPIIVVLPNQNEPS